MKGGNKVAPVEMSWFQHCFFATAERHYQLVASVSIIQQQSCDGNCQTFCKTSLRVLLCASITKANGGAKCVLHGKHSNV